MHGAYLVVTMMAIAFDGFSGVSALVHFAPIIPPMQRAGVPLSWLTNSGQRSNFRPSRLSLGGP
jgi:hypothetical protein